jgi:hypothetical protein
VKEVAPREMASADLDAECEIAVTVAARAEAIIMAKCPRTPIQMILMPVLGLTGWRMSGE